MFEDDTHAACVTHWMTREAQGLLPDQLRLLLERVLAALWQSALGILGEVTLTAIADRVLYTTAERFPVLAPLQVGEAGVRFAATTRDVHHVRGAHDEAPAADVALPAAVQFVLVEFLSVLGNLTAEILTPALHTALDGVTLAPPAPPASHESIDAVRDLEATRS